MSEKQVLSKYLAYFDLKGKRSIKVIDADSVENANIAAKKLEGEYGNFFRLTFLCEGEE